LAISSLKETVQAISSTIFRITLKFSQPYDTHFGTGQEKLFGC
jgi:hypothetical protein